MGISAKKMKELENDKNFDPTALSKTPLLHMGRKGNSQVYFQKTSKNTS
jgi:hypothetical protein